MTKKINWEILTPVLAITLPLIWGIYTFIDTKKIEIQTRKIEASKTFLDLQLTLFQEITALTARLANTPPEQRAEQDIKRFWELYWGELALVEKGGVESAMVEFGGLLRVPNVTTKVLQPASLKIAHRVRDELAESWGVDHWKKE